MKRDALISGEPGKAGNRENGNGLAAFAATATAAGGAAQQGAEVEASAAADAEDVAAATGPDDGALTAAALAPTGAPATIGGAVGSADCIAADTHI